MNKENWVWMPHAGHFICGHRCRFTLNTYVGGYIVSTVGELPYTSVETKEISKKYNKNAHDLFDEIGCDRLYETMVFKARKSTVKDKNYQCCPYEAIVDGDELDFEPYNTATEAYRGHLKLCDKWSKK